MNVKTGVSADEMIFSCLKLDAPKSFFLFAGAGSGKTRSLVTALKKFRYDYSNLLRRNGQKVAIITYTNAACDEINHRLDYDSTFNVSTIHSFAWDLISTFTNDIRNFLRESLRAEIVDLNEKQGKAKNKTTKTYAERDRRIESKTKRLENLDSIKRFTYNPNGDNSSRDSLNHSEVIEIASFFFMNKPLMQNILIRKYPIILIDESQDTKKELIDAFFEVQNKFSNEFSLGMFGDTMQRIYLDGKENLGQHIPETWAKPQINDNHRCPKRVVALINRIRSDVDGQQQIPAKQDEGLVRLFIVGTNATTNKSETEKDISSQMRAISDDQGWANLDEVKVLILEHHMAARRGGFSTFFDPLYEVEKFKTGLLDGSLPIVSFFAKQILPLVIAKKSGVEFGVAKIVRQYSPFLRRDSLEGSNDQIGEIRRANTAVKSLVALWSGGQDPKMCDVLKEIYKSRLLQIPDSLLAIVERLNSESVEEVVEAEEDKDDAAEAIEKSLQASFSEFEKYVQYVSDKSRFGTHQGVKGLQFPRVMVILDDEDARGFLFSYEKLFGAEDLSETDIKNQREGKETGLDRTRRLFYVTCSRAEKSLAIVAYSSRPESVKDFALKYKWFTDEEIVII